MDNECFLSLFLAAEVVPMESESWKRNTDGTTSDAKGRKRIKQREEHLSLSHKTWGCLGDVIAGF